MDPQVVTPPPDATKPSRTLGFWSGTALVVASMLGTGVFTTSGFLMADLRSPWLVLASWLLGGGIALLGAVSYGALARHLPESGGEYLFLSRTLHPAAGYLAGWVSLLVGFSAPLAAATNAFGEYTREWLPGWSPAWTGTGLLLVASAVHAWDVRVGVTAQNVAVLLKVVLVSLFIGFGITRIPGTPTAASPAWDPFTFAMSLVWVSFSYSGWNAAIYLGSEVKDPERNLPRALLAGTLSVTALYLAINAVFVLAVPSDLIAGRLEVGRLAARHLGGQPWAEAATLLIALALVTAVSSLVMTGPRVYARIASDGYLPAALRQTSGPPRPAILFQLALALLLLWTSTYRDLLTFIGFTLSLSTAATVGGLIVLRLRSGPELRVPGWPWVPVLFVLSVLALTTLSVARAPLPSLAGVGVLAVGWLFWRLSGKGGGRPPPEPGKDAGNRAP